MMGKKNKNRQQQRRQMKAQKRRVAAKKARGLRVQKAQAAKAAQKETLGKIAAWKQDEDKGFGFWACNGINYITSDYSTGVWDPVYPSIYEGVLPDADTVETFISTHIDPNHAKFTEIGRTLLGWWFSGETGMYALAKEAERRAAEAGGFDGLRREQ